ncbi:MAG: YdeI/OmpD-associated family protein [Bacteroidota bacterium]
MESKIEKFNTGMHYLRIPQNSDLGDLKSEKRVLCNLNSEIEFHCAVMTKKEGYYFIYIGTKILHKLKLKLGDEIHFELKKDNSEFQFDYPEELEEVFRTDKQAKDKFDSLTDGNKRGLIYIVNQVKSVDKKIERSLKIAEKLKCGITSPRLIMKK